MRRAKRIPSSLLSALVFPLFFGSLLVACSTGTDETRTAGTARPVTTRVPGQPAVEADAKPASAVAPANSPAQAAAGQPAATVNAAAGENAQRRIQRPAREPRPAPTCAPGFRQVGEEDKDCSTFGQCCKPEAGAH